MVRSYPIDQKIRDQAAAARASERGDMNHPGFFERAGPFPLHHIANVIGAEIQDGRDPNLSIEDVRSLSAAGPNDLSFFENRKYVGELEATNAGACVLAKGDVALTPTGTIALTSATPYKAFAQALSLFYADALRSKAANCRADDSGSMIHASAEIAETAIVEPGAVVGREAKIGPGTIIAAGAVVGYRVVMGKDCYAGAGSTITHAILGNGVIIHAGARIGQDGYGFAMGPDGHFKIPQIGRVLIDDDVEIGSNTTVDRGSMADTKIGAGTKIDNLVQIAHNVVMGRNCIVVSHSGIAGSTTLGDGVVMGAKSGALGHVKIGDGAQIAGMCHVKDDVPPGARMGGTPAQPFKDWARELAAIRRLARKGS